MYGLEIVESESIIILLEFYFQFKQNSDCIIPEIGINSITDIETSFH